MGPDPLPMAQMRRHVSDIEASSGEGAGCSGAITTAAFQADPFGTGLTDPLHERLMSTGVVGEGPLSHRHPERVHRTRRQCRLVGVDPNRRHLPAPSLTEYDGRGPAGQVCVESKPRSYQAMAGPLVFAAGALELQAKAKAGPHQVSHLPLGRTFAEKASTTLRTHQDDIGQASTCAGTCAGTESGQGGPDSDAVALGSPRFGRHWHGLGPRSLVRRLRGALLRRDLCPSRPGVKSARTRCRGGPETAHPARLAPPAADPGERPRTWPHADPGERPRTWPHAAPGERPRAWPNAAQRHDGGCSSRASRGLFQRSETTNPIRPRQDLASADAFGRA